MARIAVDPNYSNPTFPRATAAADLFLKEDVQSLAAALSSHHHGIGYGLPVKLAAAVDMPDWYRSTGHTTAFAASGAGIEMYYDAATGGFINGYTRPGGPWEPVTVSGSLFTVSIGGVGNAMTVLADRSVQFAGPAVTIIALNCSGAVTMQSNAHIMGNLQLDGSLSGGTSISMTGPLTVTTTASANTLSGDLNVGGLSHLTGTVTCNAISCTAITASAASTFAGLTSTNHQVNGTLNVTSTAAISGALTANQVTVPNSFYGSGCVINNGTNNAGAYLYVNGTAGGTGGWNIIPSSVRYKSNLRSLNEALDLVKDDTLHGVYYTVSPENQEPFEAYGFLAEPWYAAAPETVHVLDGEPAGMDYTQIVPIVFEALKDYIAATDVRLAALEAA